MLWWLLDLRLDVTEDGEYTSSFGRDTMGARVFPITLYLPPATFDARMCWSTPSSRSRLHEEVCCGLCRPYRLEGGRRFRVAKNLGAEFSVISQNMPRVQSPPCTNDLSLASLLHQLTLSYYHTSFPDHVLPVCCYIGLSGCKVCL